MTPNAKLRRSLFRTMQDLGRWARFGPVNPEFQAGMVLLASVRLATTDEARLAEVTGVSPEFVGRIAARCRKSRLWRGGKVRAMWMDEKDGDFAFVIDLLVACGWATRETDPKLTASGKARREQLRSAGRCTNCGKPPERGIVCAACKASIKASKQRRKESDGQLTELKRVEPWYLHAQGGE